MLISNKAAKIKAYVAGEQPQGGGWIKLNTNENPYACTACEEYLATVDRAKLRLYPDPDALALKSEIAALHGVDVDQVFVGNGSDEVIAVAFQALFDAHAKPVLAPDLTYSFYPVYASLYDVAYLTEPLSADFTLPIDRFCERTDVEGIVFANPNAPTSIGLTAVAVRKILSSNADIPVIVDEAYVDFGGESVVPYLSEHPNLLVTRTLSKSYSLAGLRVGYAIGSVELIAALERIKNCFNSYTLDMLAIEIAAAAVRDQKGMTERAAAVMATRARVAAELSACGAHVLPSSANFLFVKHDVVSGAEIFDRLKERKILVRRWNAPRISEYLRITIGTDAQMDALVAAYREIVGADRA